MDKVKQQATQVAQKGKEGVKAGQAKMEQAQSKKRGDALLRDLGATFYAEKTGKGTPQTAAEIERLLAEIRAHEDEHGTVETAPTADTVAPTGGAGTASEGGDFTLDDV